MELFQITFDLLKQYRWTFVTALSVFYFLYIIKRRRQPLESVMGSSDLSEILPNLYLSSYVVTHDDNTLVNKNIHAILAVTSSKFGHANLPKHITSKHMPIDDMNTADIKSLFLEAINFIDSFRKQNKPVLVHCMAGVSRSPTIIMAYLMTKEGFSFPKAYEHVKKRRSLVQPNYGFMRQLMEYERELTGTLSDEFYSNYIYDIGVSRLNVDKKRFLDILRKNNYDVLKAFEEVDPQASESDFS